MTIEEGAPEPTRRVLLTGATGYVGGRLLRRLERSGHAVRCLARRPEFLKSQVGPGTEIVQGDVMDPESLPAALGDIDTAYYLVHSMGTSERFEETDRTAASNFAEAARECGVRRIIYLGGLGEEGQELSPHLRSRHEVGDVLRASGVSVLEFRAAVVIGSASLSFEMIRALVERLPVMITPRWVNVKTQPIAITDLLEYLEAAFDRAQAGNEIFEIGGRDVVSYGELMREYARQRGLKRMMIPIPLLTPRLSSLWLSLVTPLYARVGKKLVESLRHPTIVRDDSAIRAFEVEPVSMAAAIRSAMHNEDRKFAESRWFDAVSAAGSPRQWGGVRFGTRLIDTRCEKVAASPEQAFTPIRRIGGEQGWYYGNWLWQIRGFMDLLVGGVGMRRARRDPEHLVVGDIVDCWRVDAVEQNRRLLLSAEMKLPGRAWLEFVVEDRPGGSTVRQTAVFDPVGLLGQAYWYSVYPLHGLVFSGMLDGIVKAAE